MHTTHKEELHSASNRPGHFLFQLPELLALLLHLIRQQGVHLALLLAVLWPANDVSMHE